MAVLESGIHSTIAGVLLAFMIACRTALNQEDFLRDSRDALDAFERATERECSILNDVDQQGALQALESLGEKVQLPFYRMEHAIHPWVPFAIMPLFAFANAGVPLLVDRGKTVGNPITLGVLLGLLLGKPIGITLA